MRRKYDPWTMGNSERPPLKKIHEDMEKSNKTSDAPHRGMKLLIGYSVIMIKYLHL